MKIIKIFFAFFLVSFTMCSCSKTDFVDNSCPPTLSIHYVFEKNLSKEEAIEYIQNNESIGKVTSKIPLSNLPTDNFSSNFLDEGTELYLINNQIVAVYDDGETYYAMLLDVSVAS